MNSPTDATATVKATPLTAKTERLTDTPANLEPATARTGLHRNALTAGTALLWYRIERVIGQGAFGITYLAHDGNLDRLVAIKEYLPGQIALRDRDAVVLPQTEELAAEYGSGLSRFVSEARTLAKFEHPNIVRVHNVFEANGTAYMVMQYEEGEGLDRVLKRVGTLDESALLRILHPLLAGLELIHARGFVHRDIKPANVFIRADGSPLLLDFGSARLAAGDSAQTLTNFASPGYAPIEQYAGKSDQQGPWSDIYALGATLYRAMTGQAPPDAVGRSQSIAHDTQDSYARDTVPLRREYSPALRSAVDHALQFRIRDRPQSVAAWRAELPGGDSEDANSDSAVLDARELASEGTLAVARHANLVTDVRRWRWMLAGIAAACATVIVYWWQVDRRPAAPAQTVESPGVTPLIPAGVTTTPASKLRDAPALVAGVALATPREAVPQNEDVASLLAQASNDLKANRLTTPAGRNAYEKYRQVLASQPNNLAAQRGIIAISDQYLYLTYRDIGRNRLGPAEQYLRKAETITPMREEVLAARATFNAARTGNPSVLAPPAGDAGPSLVERLGKILGDRRAPPPRNGNRGDDFHKRLGGG